MRLAGQLDKAAGKVAGGAGGKSQKAVKKTELQNPLESFECPQVISDLCVQIYVDTQIM